MTASSNLRPIRTADSSDRTAVVRIGLTGSPQHGARPAGFARRFISALMRSLAAPHV